MVCGLGLLWLLLGAMESRDLPRRKLRIVIYATLLATAAGLIVKADSMTSLSTMALAGAVLVIITQRWVSASRGLLHVVVWSAVGMAVSAIFLDSTILHALGRNATLTGRTDIWRAVLALHTNPLIGTGYESFWLGDRLQFVWDATDKGILQAHNGYLEIYINMGWIGVILLGALIVTGYRHAVASYYRDPQSGRLGLAMFTAALMFNLSEAGFRMMTLIWFVFLMAITGIPARLREREPAYQAAPVRVVTTGRVRVLQ
jgi:O-antigen ligase